MPWENVTLRARLFPFVGLEAAIADTHGIDVSNPATRLFLTGAVTADQLAAVSAVMPPKEGSELFVTFLALCGLLVPHPVKSSVLLKAVGTDPHGTRYGAEFLSHFPCQIGLQLPPGDHLQLRTTIGAEELST